MTVVHPGFVCAPELLPVPRPDRVHPEQAAGRACVWCGKEPTIDLGTRLSTHTGAVQSWAPRACQPCAAREAARVLAIHVTNCHRCRGRDGCPDARALRQLAADSRSRTAIRRPGR
ncbi:hypothetical protein ABTX34_11370 [Streptomyces sp. NPDC096538]|uniref:hypothetical protein n=1 Tax=Streptomyces sp. NPDC096538 TaxID=3155427 RepID=UPI00332A7C29